MIFKKIRITEEGKIKIITELFLKRKIINVFYLDKSEELSHLKNIYPLVKDYMLKQTIKSNILKLEHIPMCEVHFKDNIVFKKNGYSDIIFTSKELVDKINIYDLKIDTKIVPLKYNLKEIINNY